MRTFLLSLAIAACSALPVQAQTSGLQSLENGVDARGWEAVGRLDINGKGFCTGALIAPDIVLTAAHCMFEDDGREIDVARVQFLAGLRGGRAEATRSIAKAIVHPAYDPTGPVDINLVRNDVALLKLSQPIRTFRVQPFEVSSSRLSGTQVGVVSYALDRESAPSLQETCNVVGQQSGVLFMDCDINFGASGAPVFRIEDDVPRLISVYSVMAEVDGQTMALGTDLAGPITTLREALEADRGLFGTPPASARIVRPGERTDTGALFVRP